MIQGTAHAEAGLLHDVGVDLGGLHARMSEQFLHGADVRLRFQRWVANECRKVCGVTRFVSPAWAAADFTMR